MKKKYFDLPMISSKQIILASELLVQLLKKGSIFEHTFLNKPDVQLPVTKILTVLSPESESSFDLFKINKWRKQVNKIIHAQYHDSPLNEMQV